MNRYRVGILGCGPRGAAIARGYAAHPRTEVAALCDLDVARAEPLRQEMGLSACFTDLDRMLHDIHPDIVVIATGTEFHYALCRRVIESGAHVDVEKPICTDLAEADALVGLARDRGLRIAVHHQGRVGGSLQALRRAISEGRIGQPRYVTGSDKGYYGGYGLMNIGTHLINNFLALAGPCRSVVATATVAGRPVTPEDVVVAPGGMGVVVGESLTATLDFQDGMAGTLLLHRFPRGDSTAYAFEVLGSEGRLFWKFGGAWWLPTPHYVPDGEHDAWQPLPVGLPEGYDPAMPADAAEFAYAGEFVRALDEGREHECGGAEGRHVLEIMLGIFEAGARGARVELPQSRRDHPLLRWRREAGLPAPSPGPRDYNAWLQEEDARVGCR